MSNTGSCVDTDADHACSYVPLFIDGECKLRTVESHLFGLTGTASHADTQNIRIIRFSFENRLHWQFEVRPLLFTVCICV
jgi:hypothetical protein